MSGLIKLSKKQEEIVGLPLDPISVAACAGSGKTRTAVHRVAKIRRDLVDPHGLVALLSFSNVAVDTFRLDYAALSRSGATAGGLNRVEIDTVDGFITSNILRPHGHRVMGCQRVPFLVTGAEPFMKGFKVFDGTISYPTADLKVRVTGGKFEFGVGRQFQTAILENFGEAALKKLGKTGAYTHNHARYWAIMTLLTDKMVMRAIARRYPQILVDEAQDIGPEHQLILEAFIEAGSKVSLIGDENQAIYEFADADGEFLREYSKRAGITPRDLDRNFRAVPSLVTIACKLTGRTDESDREPPTCLNGGYYIPYKPADRDKVLDTFRQLLTKAETETGDAAILCRAKKEAAEWAGEGGEQGQGAIKYFVKAAIARDQGNRLDVAYDNMCRGLVGLLDDKHQDLCSRLMAVGRIEERRLRQAIFTFLRDKNNGLPSGTLVANGEWHAKLAARLKVFVPKLCADHGLTAGANLGLKLANRALDAAPLIKAPDLAQADLTPIRVSTVHRVKGESIGGVMYVVTKPHLKALLEGPKSENGRIGYVALTRARNLFVLAVPESCLKEFEGTLVAFGFQKPGGGGAVAAVKAVDGDGGAPDDGGGNVSLSSVFD
jgi:superfamily I DNA/RNA helicase